MFADQIAAGDRSMKLITSGNHRAGCSIALIATTLLILSWCLLTRRDAWHHCLF